MPIEILEFERPVPVDALKYPSPVSLGQMLMAIFRDSVVELDAGQHDITPHAESDDNPYLHILTVLDTGKAVLQFVSRQPSDDDMAVLASGARIEPTPILPSMHIDDTHPIIVCSETNDSTHTTLIHRVLAYREEAEE